jgi:hypothetical protein
MASMTRFCVLSSLFLIAAVAACGDDSGGTADATPAPTFDASSVDGDVVDGDLADGSDTDGGDAPDSGAPDADTTVDASSIDGSTADAAPLADAGPNPSCVVPLEGFGALGDVVVAVSTAGASDLWGSFPLDQSGTPDTLFIELWSGWGAFPNQVTTGTFPLTGDDGSYQTCGACVYIRGDVVGPGTSNGFWMATGGTLTLTSIEGNLTGTLSNVTFAHMASGTQTVPANDGCDTSLESVAFDGPIPAGT